MSGTVEYREFRPPERLRRYLRCLWHLSVRADAGSVQTVYPVAELALERGFADQAHATRELRTVTGTTPARLREALRRDRDGDASVRLAAAFVRGRIA